MMNNEQFNNSKVNVLGVKFNNTTMLEMIENIKSFFENKTESNLFIVTANP
ncbi:glycosyltransferase, partial [Staphylococcus aureus]|nr:glycosyltransferase [Staphylococcus aureus]